jgi:hypothetical protein
MHHTRIMATHFILPTEPICVLCMVFAINSDLAKSSRAISSVNWLKLLYTRHQGLMRQKVRTAPPVYQPLTATKNKSAALMKEAEMVSETADTADSPRRFQDFSASQSDII